MIQKILEDKYGIEILFNLMTENRFNLENEAYKGTQLELVETQMNNMIKLGLLSVDDYEKGKPWAFDVSGTYANLKETDNLPVMIIGEDPRVIDKDYQVVYGFAQRGENFEKGNITDKFKKFLIGLFYSEQELSKMSDLELQIFLAKFYISDQCHFTPQGLDNRKEELANWKDIKWKTAQYFIKKEIEAVKPKYIITHGGTSRKFLSKILGVKILEAGKIGNKFYLGTYNEIEIIGITHIGSRNTTGHWYKYLTETREKLIRKKIQI